MRSSAPLREPTKSSWRAWRLGEKKKEGGPSTALGTTVMPSVVEASQSSASITVKGWSPPTLNLLCASAPLREILRKSLARNISSRKAAKPQSGGEKKRASRRGAAAQGRGRSFWVGFPQTEPSALHRGRHAAKRVDAVPPSANWEGPHPLRCGPLSHAESSLRLSGSARESPKILGERLFSLSRQAEFFLGL